VPLPMVENPVVDYVPHAKPGHRAPHLFVRRDGHRISTIMLFDRRFVLLAGPDGHAWVDAATRLAETRSPAIAAYRVAADGDVVPETDMCALYGISPSGAVLVRPDGHVAYRANALPFNPVAALDAALDVTLGRAGAGQLVR